MCVPSAAPSLVSSSPIWCGRPSHQTIMDGLPQGKTALPRQIDDRPGVVLRSAIQGPNPDAPQEDIKKPIGT